MNINYRTVETHSHTRVLAWLLSYRIRPPRDGSRDCDLEAEHV